MKLNIIQQLIKQKEVTGKRILMIELHFDHRTTSQMTYTMSTKYLKDKTLKNTIDSF